MRSAQQFEVRSRTDAQHRVVTVAMARPAEPKWPLGAQVAFITGSAAALWIAIGVAVSILL
ncbi:hypothetical protein [Rhizorhabdus dicambivorans]|uniref:Uncharacterized protein n=1 Tax=Rhizorhabdus dicambivorans TaxID=1850238 RepID=A0A2A4FW36_9SPHN|nr:hypothetical protein [Rhizorhabdus dicambivorans]ATE65597.1 hypothetical protein CMV14_15280 [Rhizorhabdus dicambivorans]PCE41940.1 hypothetical protein COO09_13035 [Rhizorhabdus dicambivorans]